MMVRNKDHLVLLSQLYRNIDKMTMQTTQWEACMMARHVRMSCAERRVETHYLCGVIDTSVYEPKWHRNWTIQVVGNSIHLLFNRFDVISSKKCNINSLDLFVRGACNHHELYCGNLPPWKKIYPQDTITLGLVLTYLELKAEFKESYIKAQMRQILLKINSQIQNRGDHLNIDWTVNQRYEVSQVLSFYLYATHHKIISLRHIHIHLAAHTSYSGNIETK